MECSKFAHEMKREFLPNASRIRVTIYCNTPLGGRIRHTVTTWFVGDEGRTISTVGR